jgi:putative transposase
MRFVHWYNHEHRHSGIRYVTPAQRHVGQDGPMLAARHALYQRARQSNPRRWSGPTRNWTPIPLVTLNPERDALVRRDAPSPSSLSCSIGEPAFPPRPDATPAMARNVGDGRSAATHSHAQHGEHGADGEHRTFPAVSTTATSTEVGASRRRTTQAPQRRLE